MYPLFYYDQLDVYTNRFGIDLRRLCVAITTAMCRHCDRHRRRSYLVTIYDVYPLPSHLQRPSVAMQPPYCHINPVTIPLFSVKIATVVEVKQKKKIVIN